MRTGSTSSSPRTRATRASCSMPRPTPSSRATPEGGAMKMNELKSATKPATRRPLDELEQHRGFVDRHIGTSASEQGEMLKTLGYPSRAALIDAIVPPSIRCREPLPLSAAKGEEEALDLLKAMARRNRIVKSYIGQGYYGTHTPPVIRRNVLENPAWYTAYTPYQPEISQGRLEALLNFQTMVSDLTALPVAGASLLDEATAAAEAMTLARRANRHVSGRPASKGGTAKGDPAESDSAKGAPASRDTAKGVFLADADCMPQTLAVLATRAQPLGIELVTAELTPELIAAQPDGELFGVLLQYPGASGAVRDLAPVIEAARAAGAVAAVAADLLALTLLRPPGELGADVAVGTTQRFGVPMGFGGPHAGYICVRDGLQRQLPGRLVGVSVDADGHPAYRLALQAREQHIRREKATSNICTAQVLLAVIAAMYAAYHGPDGLAAIARRVHGKAVALAGALRERGVAVDRASFFDTVRARLGGGMAALAVRRARDAGINLYLADADTLQAA